MTADASPPAARKPFAPQAAAFSLAAAPVAIAVAYGIHTPDPSLRQHLFQLAEAIVGVGLLLGIAAGFVGRRSGRIVAVAAIGTLLDAAALAAVAFGLVHRPGPDPKLLHGHWYRSVAAPAGSHTEVLTLEANGDAGEVSFDPRSPATTGWSGRWRLDDRRLIVTVTSYTLGTPAVPTGGTYATVDTVSAGSHGELVLAIDGTKTYFTHDPLAGPDRRQNP